MKLYVLQENKPTGPFEEADIISRWKKGTVRDTDLVWTQGLNEWTPLAKLLSASRSNLILPKKEEQRVGKRERPKKYQIVLPNGTKRILTSEQVIAGCQAGKITSEAKLFELTLGVVGLRPGRPIRDFPEFGSHLWDPPANTQCYLLVDGNRQGPFLPAQIRSMWNAGTITANTLFIHSGLPDWRPVSPFCQQETRSKEAELLKQVVAAQRTTSARLWAILWILAAVFLIPFLLYQCNR